MKLYLAGQFYPRHAPGLEDLDGLRFLASFHYMDDPQTRAVVEWSTEQGYPLFLDSGAFSAYSLGAEVRLDDYLGYCLEYGDLYEAIAALDVIGDWRASRANWEAMREAGVDCIPTFHVRAPWDELERLAGETDYVALGVAGMQGRRKKVMAWLAKAFATIRDANPECRVHGFGLTSPDVMRCFPWYSVDSSAWLAARRYAVGFLGGPGRWRQFRRGDVPEDPRDAEEMLGRMVGAPGGNSLRYARMLVHNARVMLEWVDDLNRAQEVL